jgi:hypothetical protein
MMQGGLDRPGLGFAVFCAVKFAGYSIAGFLIARHFAPIARRNPFVLGGVRTILGIAFGLAVGLATYLVGSLIDGPAAEGAHLLVYPGAIGLVRLLEWWLLLWLFYRPLDPNKRTARVVVIVAGTLWSFALDVPAVFGLLKTGGLHVC